MNTEPNRRACNHGSEFEQPMVAEKLSEIWIDHGGRERDEALQWALQDASRLVNQFLKKQGVKVEFDIRWTNILDERINPLGKTGRIHILSYKEGK